MYKKMGKLVTLSVGAALAVTALTFTKSEASDTTTGITQASYVAYAANSEQVTEGTVTNLNLDEYVGNLGTLSIKTVSDAGFYIVMPWSNEVIDQDGYYLFKEKTGTSYRELGWTKAFSSDISEQSIVNLDFGFDYDENGNVTYAEIENIANYISLDLSNLSVGDVFSTGKEDVNMTIIEQDGDLAFEVIYDGITYTAKINDIKWYVIKKATYTGWHVDGAVKWVASTDETVDEQEETSTDIENVTESESEDDKEIIEVAGDEDIVEIETVVIKEDEVFYSEVAGAEDVEFYGEVAGDEDEVVLNAMNISNSTVQTADRSNVIIYIAAIIGAAAMVFVTGLKVKE